MDQDEPTLEDVAVDELAGHLAVVGDELKRPLLRLHRDVHDGGPVKQRDIDAARKELKEVDHLLNVLEPLAE